MNSSVSQLSQLLSKTGQKESLAEEQQKQKVLRGPQTAGQPSSHTVR